MNKTKLGISVNLLAAITCLAPLTGGYVFFLGLVLYVVLAEKDEWLKKTALKALIVTFIFGAFSVAMDFVPNIISALNNVVSIFGGHFEIAYVGRIFNAADYIANVVRAILLFAMALLALKHEDLEVKQLDDFCEKHTEGLNEEE